MADNVPLAVARGVSELEDISALISTITEASGGLEAALDAAVAHDVGLVGVAVQQAQRLVVVEVDLVHGGELHGDDRDALHAGGAWLRGGDVGGRGEPAVGERTRGYETDVRDEGNSMENRYVHPNKRVSWETKSS